jgi:alkylation response protein AidB-like acyl-CoA dehydrogenase
LLYLIAVEQTARYCMSTAHSLHIHCHGSHLVDQICTPEQRRNILGPVIERGALLNATGSEPGRTSRGLYSLVTIADRVDGGYMVNGTKNYASLADVVDFNIIFAGIRGQSPVDGHIGLCIPKGTPGLTIPSNTWDPMGMRAAVSPNILLENCFVSDDYVIGAPGVFPRDRWQARFHLGFAAQYLGGSEGIFDYLIDYLPKRGTASDAYAQLRLGEIRIGIDSVRWLIYRAAWLWKMKRTQEAELFSMTAKHRAIENAVMTMDKAAQIAGSSAFHAKSSLSRSFRDLRVQTLHENLDKTAATLGKYHLGQEFDTTARL